jgi:hypothetical protein
MICAAFTTASVSAAVPFTSNDSNGPNPRGICLLATSSVASFVPG